MASGELEFKEKEVVKAEKVEETKEEKKEEIKKTEEANKPTSGCAIAGLICSVLFFVPLTGLAGLILSIIGLSQSNKPEYSDDGKGLAIGGIVVAVIRIFITAIMLLIMFGLFGLIASMY